MTSSNPVIQNRIPKDNLWRNLGELPYFRGLLRAVEARFYEGIELPSPTLDLGCGDGHFASIAFDRCLDIGVDPWWEPIFEAKNRHNYSNLAQSEGARQPFPDNYFASAISNSVLEHIPDVEAVLVETARVLQPGAPFVFCVPNHQFLSTLSVGRFFDCIGLKYMGDWYRTFFNRISRHQHCDTPEKWISRLETVGFEVERWWHYFSPDALRTLEWGHYFGIPSLISKVLTGRWILCRTSWNLSLTHRLVQRYYLESPQQEDGVYTFYITRRI